MKNIKVSMLVLSLVVSASASDVKPPVVAPTIAARASTAFTQLKTGVTARTPAFVVNNLPTSTYAQAALATVAVAGAGYLVYKYGRTVCSKVVSAVKSLTRTVINNPGKSALAVVSIAAITALYKYNRGATVVLEPTVTTETPVATTAVVSGDVKKN